MKYAIGRTLDDGTIRILRSYDNLESAYKALEEIRQACVENLISATAINIYFCPTEKDFGMEDLC